MYFNNTEVETAPKLETYEPKPTWGETLSASFKNFTSVNLSTSEQNYYYDSLKENIKTWTSKDKENKDIYKRVSILSPDAIEHYEDLYNKGKIDLIASDKSEIYGLTYGLTGGAAFLKFKELEKQFGYNSLKSIKDTADSRAKSDYLTSLDTLNKSEYTSAKMLGTMGGVMTDPITLATLLLGTFVGGGSVAINALRAFGQEAMIETAAQAAIAPKVYAYKKELELKTSIMEESINALSSIATAGAFRAVGSATYDLTAKGIAQLKAKDPELARDYENLSSNQATDNLNSHVDNMHKVEFGSGVENIDTPNKIGEEINNTPPYRELDDFEPPQPKEEDMMLTIGKSEDGTPIEKSYADLEADITKEIDQVDAMFNCLRGL